MTPLNLLDRARSCLRANDFHQTEHLCRQLLQTQEGHAEGWLFLGSALQGQGRHGDAVDAFVRACRLAPASAEAHLGLGRALASVGRRDEANGPLGEAVRLAPEHVEARTALGVNLGEQGRLAEALPQLHEAVRLRPDWAPGHLNLGVALAQSGRLPEAVGPLEEALRLEPNYAEACCNLGNVLKDLRRADEAVILYRRALELRPSYAEVYNNLGLLLTEQGRLDEALVLLRQAVRLRPQAAEGHNNLGLAYATLGRFAEAEGCYQEALRLDPNYAEAQVNLGNALKEQGRFGEAQACYQLGLWLAPQMASAHYNRSLAWLQAGEWDKGWTEYEWRWRRRTQRERPFKQPRWDGSPLAGRTILLWCEQGLGDAIQFARYAALVKGRGGRVVLECPPPLQALLSSCPGVDELVAEGETPPAFDVQAPLMSLPALFDTTVETMPADIPFLKADETRVAAWRSWLESVDGFRVGVVWQGNPRFQWDRFRSFDLTELAPLAAVPGVKLVSLQKGPGTEQVRALKGRFEVIELDGLDAEGGAFLDTAAVLKCLDLVVTADTAAAHLAGALGVRVWLALSAVSDWRWLRGREETPWYPTMRLFRQEQVGAWQPVFERMAREAQRLKAGLGCCPPPRVEMSPGELLDRLTILRIKADRFQDADRRVAARAEAEALERTWAAAPASEALTGWRIELQAVNEALWAAEDGLRDCERAADFGARFIELARSVYRLNDQRTELKRLVNQALRSPVREEKQYGTLPG
jgi:tetratricopeptide (TPR) repeat protein